MKKFIIPIAIAAVLCGAIALVQFNEETPAPQTQVSEPTPSVTATTRMPDENFTPSFSPVSVPEEMKQHYTINPKASQVITGNSGTMLLIPDNAFTDRQGNAVNGKVILELVEGITRQDILDMNLGTMSDQGMLETGGMIYVDAKSETGAQLQLANGKEIEAEIPALQKHQGMQLWEGQQNDDGSLIWKAPEPISNSLTDVPVESLSGSDSQTASFTSEDPKIVSGWMRIVTTENDVVTGDSSFPFFDSLFYNAVKNNDTMLVGTFSNTGIAFVNFADDKFEHTNISTAEFRSRLPFIRQACDNRISHCYADYPNRALWKSDAAAADSLDKIGCPLSAVFRRFAEMKQDKVNPRDPKTVAALDAARQTAIEKYSKRIGEQQEMYAGYTFGMKKLGWVNIDALYHSGLPIVFNAHVDGLDATANPMVSLLIPGRSIVIPGYKRPNGNYSFTHGEQEQAMEFPQGEHAFILARSGEGKDFRYALKEVVFGGNAIESLTAKSGTKKQMDLDMGNVPEEPKDEGVKIIDDWYTQSIKNGTGCICNSESFVYPMRVGPNK